MVSPFSIDYTNLDEVIAYAASFPRKKGFVMYVVKYPEYGNYSITMQLKLIFAKNGRVIWSSLDGRIVK